MGPYEQHNEHSQQNFPPLNSIKLRAGRRSYFFDVRATKSEKDFFISITENKKVEGQVKRTKVFLYKEDFKKFADALNESINFASSKLKELGVEILPRQDKPEDEKLP